MTMRLELEFPTPLDEDAGVRVLLAAASLPEIRRVVISRDRRFAAVYATDMAPDRLSAVMTEAGLAVQKLRTGLAPETAASLDAPPGERVRPIGR